MFEIMGGGISLTENSEIRNMSGRVFNLNSNILKLKICKEIVLYICFDIKCISTNLKLYYCFLAIKVSEGYRGFGTFCINDSLVSEWNYDIISIQNNYVYACKNN